MWSFCAQLVGAPAKVTVSFLCSRSIVQHSSWEDSSRPRRVTLPNRRVFLSERGWFRILTFVTCQNTHLQVPNVVKTGVSSDDNWHLGNLQVMKEDTLFWLQTQEISMKVLDFVAETHSNPIWEDFSWSFNLIESFLPPFMKFSLLWNIFKGWYVNSWLLHTHIC